MQQARQYCTLNPLSYPLAYPLFRPPSRGGRLSLEPLTIFKPCNAPPLSPHPPSPTTHEEFPEQPPHVRHAMSLAPTLNPAPPPPSAPPTLLPHRRNSLSSPFACRRPMPVPKSKARQLIHPLHLPQRAIPKQPPHVQRAIALVHLSLDSPLNPEPPSPLFCPTHLSPTQEEFPEQPPYVRFFPDAPSPWAACPLPQP